MTHSGGARLTKICVSGPLWAVSALVWFCLAVAWGPTSRAATPPPLTSVRAVNALTDAEAAQGLPVQLQATVTYTRNYERALFVQDGDAAVYIDIPPTTVVAPGDRVLIQGHTKASFKPIVISTGITVEQHGALPPIVTATFDQLIGSTFDCRYVSVYGVVRDASSIVKSGVRSILLELHTDGGQIDAAVDADNPDALDGLLDAQVLVTGVVSGQFDGKTQLIGIELHVNSLDSVKVLRRAASGPWALPLTPMDEILAGYHIADSSRRVRVHGTLTYFQPGSAAVLQDGTRSLWVMTSSIAPLHVGDLAEAIGFPALNDGLLALSDAQIRDLATPAPIAPTPATWDELSTGKHLFDLVSLDGQVVAQVRGGSRDEYVLESNGNLFSAVYRRPPPGTPQATDERPFKRIPAGTKVRVTGVCMTNSAGPLDSRVPFDVLLRSPDDIAVTTGAPLLTVANLARLVGVLCFIVLVVSAWGWALRRRVRQQTAAITAQSEAEAVQQRRATQLEQWRSRILEDINSSRPLGDIVEHITEMVSFMLNGAPCWCEITEGPLLGRPPASREGFRILSREIPSRSGLTLGHLFAALDSPEANEEAEQDALAPGVRLATLSIETRKLYSDLLHRSEFDLLTDMYNRFSLERHLHDLIEKAREIGTTFGLIYVDLDDFKLVNDLYGHHVGDLYLQEVSLRMKRQLRTGDILGRLGGDEFAALVSVVRGRSDVEEIAQRLERCFDAPFAMEGYVLRGAASVGLAIYPTDGTTADSLLSAADAAMYVAKNNRRAQGQPRSRING